MLLRRRLRYILLYMEWSRPDGYVVTDDKSRIDFERVYGWLSDAYWALGRSRDVMARSIENSVALSCLDPDGVQVGFARWVSDGATFGWLCDVVVDPQLRGRGFGTFMVESAVQHPYVDDVGLRLLATRDAHGLYEQFGFIVVPNPLRWMELRNSTHL